MSNSTSALTVDRAEELIRELTDGLVNIVDTTGQFLLKLDDGTVIDTKGWKGWEWTHGVALAALAHHAAHKPSSSSSQYSLKTALEWFETQYKLSNGKGAPKNINTMAPFYCLAQFLRNGDIKDGGEKAKWQGWCDEWAEWLIRDLPKTKEGGFQHMTYAALHDQNLWDDTLMMSCLPLTQIGLLNNRADYLAEATYQFILHAQYLVDTPTGLWFHGWTFTPSGGHNFARALWARGNSWITIAIPIFLEIMGDHLAKDSADYRFLVSTWRRQVEKLVELQDADTGLWHTLLVDPSSYVETSASAGFSAGIFMGLRMGLISDKKFLDCATRGLQGVINQIQPDGELANVSFGTGMGSDFQFYKDIRITPMPYGQALAMLALVEWERLQGGGNGN